MPRYFFNIDNSISDEDDEGTDLPNPQVARHAAVLFAADYLRQDPAMIWDGHRLRVEVRDEAGNALLWVVVTATIPQQPAAGEC